MSVKLLFEACNLQNSFKSTYRKRGNFRGVEYFGIFVATKITFDCSHEIFLTRVKRSGKTYNNEVSQQAQEVQKSGDIIASF